MCFDMEFANVVGYVFCAVKCCEVRLSSPSRKCSRRGGLGCKGSSGFRKLFSAKVCWPMPWSLSISVSPLFYRVEMRFWGEKGGRKKFYKIRLEGLTYTTLCAIIAMSLLRRNRFFPDGWSLSLIEDTNLNRPKGRQVRDELRFAVWVSQEWFEEEISNLVSAVRGTTWTEIQEKRSKNMKKLMFAAAAAFCGTVFALESANVVG